MLIIEGFNFFLRVANILIYDQGKIEQQASTKEDTPTQKEHHCPSVVCLTSYGPPTRLVEGFVNGQDKRATIS